jgi:colanic acid biosynthesis glycosyl transferase WcaI
MHIDPQPSLSETSNAGSRGRVHVFYHFFHPDKVVSAVHYTELCEDLTNYGWTVSAFAGNRGSANAGTVYPARSLWRSIQINRVYRPAWHQSKSIGRLLNSAWLILAWVLVARRRLPVPDVVIIGTDPVLSVLLAWVWRRLHPNVKIVHWCFDLYPEAAFADGILLPTSLLARLLQHMLKRSYACCDLVVDLGLCMRKRLQIYDRAMQSVTLVPWALSEPAAPQPVDLQERSTIFGEARLGLMYSGSFGKAHALEEMLELMRLMRGDATHLALSVRGNRAAELNASVTEADTNISFAPFAPYEQINQRLSSADIHIITLRDVWTGTVVPSKFFGALAVGRPVIFCGSRESCIAQWIEQYQLGWVLSAGSAPSVAKTLRLLIRDKASLLEINQRCFDTYHEHFSRGVTSKQWDAQLQMLMETADQRGQAT